MNRKNKNPGGMSERQAERILETFENGSKNGEQWAHDVVLHRGTDKYAHSIETLNEAFRLKSIDKVIKPLKPKQPSPAKMSH
jgi:hypothetical protein